MSADQANLAAAQSRARSLAADNIKLKAKCCEGEKQLQNAQQELAGLRRQVQDLTAAAQTLQTTTPRLRQKKPIAVAATADDNRVRELQDAMVRSYRERLQRQILRYAVAIFQLQMQN